MEYQKTTNLLENTPNQRIYLNLSLVQKIGLK